MSRFLITIIVFLFSVLQVSAQNKSLLLERMNEIKSQTEVYYWDQYTHPDADTAKVNATKRLLIDLNINRDETSQLSVQDVMPYASYINIDRGNLKQYFVYIKKADAVSIVAGSSNSLLVSNPSFNQQPVGNLDNVASTQHSFVPEAFVQRIVDTKSFMDVYKLLKSLQSQGQIMGFGSLKDVKDYSSLSLILFDLQSQQLITLLSPVTATGKRINIVNGWEDSLDNYPSNMTAVIWYMK